MNESFDENQENLSAEQKTVISTADAASVKTAVGRKRPVKSGMFGLAEIIAVTIGLLSLLGVALFYSFFVLPSQSDLQSQKVKRDNLETEINKQKKNLGDFTTTESKVAELVQSVDVFESNNLPIGTFGSTDIYSRVNQLIRGYDLQNTSGPDYSRLEPTIQKKSTEEKAGKDRMRSLFPGMYVSMTVEGSYQNLRRFIRDIENSSQFVLINSVQLESSETVEKRKAEEQAKSQTQAPKVSKIPDGQQTNPGVNPIGPNYQQVNPTDPRNFQNGIPNPNSGQFPQKPSSVKPKNLDLKPAPKGRLRGEVVSLHLEMATYFRRDTPKSLETK